MRKIYLDNAATTAVSKTTVKAMLPYFSEKYGNPSSKHAFGQEARKAVEQAKAELAKEIGAKPWEIVLTSGGTESNNLTLFGLAAASQKKKIIISAIEHPSVYESAMELQKRGYNVKVLPVNKDGLVDMNVLKKEIDSSTLVVSVMHVNNETGVIQDIETIGKICKEKGVTFHTDALQSYGKLPIEVKKMNIDLLSAAAHKLGGPKGIGFLYVRDGVKIAPILFGGHQEKGRRSGTENVAGAVGFATALKEAKKSRIGNVKKLRDYFVSELKKIGAAITGNSDSTLYTHIHCSFAGRDGRALASYLSDKGIMCSTGSACDSNKEEDEKRVLSAIGFDERKALGAIRFTLNDKITKSNIDYTIKRIWDFMKLYNKN